MYSNYLGAEDSIVPKMLLDLPSTLPPQSFLTPNHKDRVRKESVSLDCKVESTQNNCPNKKNQGPPQKNLKKNDHNI